jgi:hypothetical protein
MRKLMIASVLLVLLNVQGCANSFETFALGAVVGAAAFSCSRNCY